MRAKAMTFAAIFAAATTTGGVAYAAWLASSAGNAAGQAEALAMPTGAAPTAPASSSGTVTLTWTAAKLAGSNLASYRVTRYPAAGGSGSVVACAPQTITGDVVSCTYNESTPGSYQYTDTPLHANWVGGESAKSGTTVVGLLDAVPPTVTVNAVPTPSKNNKPAFSGAYGTATGDVASVTVQVRSGSASGSVVATPTATVNAAAGTWSTAALAAALPDGTYVVTATQSDNVGNAKAASATFVVDTVGPAPAVTNPAHGATGVTHGSMTISGTGGRATGDSTTVSVVVTVNSAAPDPAVTASVDQATGAWSISANGIGSKRTVSVTVTQTDAAGNSGSSTSTFAT